MKKQGKKPENVCNIYFRLKRAFVSSSFVRRKDTWNNLCYICQTLWSYMEVKFKFKLQVIPIFIPNIEMHKENGLLNIIYIQHYY